MSMSKVILFGRVGKDIEIKQTASGEVATASVVTNDVWTDQTGKRQEHTEWHRVVFWNHLAKNAGLILHKGTPVYIEDRLQTRKWVDKASVERWTTEIIVERFELVNQSARNETGEE